MVTAYHAFIILVGLFLYFYRPKWIFGYWIFIFPIIFPLINVGFLIFDRELFRAMFATTYVAIRNLFLILVAWELFVYKSKLPNLRSIYLAIISISVYMFFHAIIHHPDYFEVWPKTSQIISLVLPLLFYVIRKDLLPTVKTIYICVGVILFLQLVGTIIQLLGYHIYPTFYIPYEVVLENGSSYDDSAMEGMLRGTFPSATDLCDFLAIIYLFVALEFFSRKHFSAKMFSLLTIVIGAIVAVSGIRVALVLISLSFLVCTLIYIKHHMKLFLLSALLVLFGILFLSQLDISSPQSITEYDGINRQVRGLASFVQSKKDEDDDHSTFGLSTYLLENYFIDGFLFGNGRENEGEFAYGNKGVVTLENFHNDALLAYIIVEYGIFGFCLYMFFFSSICSFLKSRVPKEERKKITLCFVAYFLLTIVDAGLFDRLNFTLVFFYSLCILAKNNMHVVVNNRFCIK